MLLRVDGSDERPIYAQIAEQITFAVASGSLRPGELVPSVRELSKQLLVNPNTVARAYRELQARGLIEPVRGTGLQVVEQAVGRCQAERREIVRERLRAAIEEALRSELDPAEIELMLREEWDRESARMSPVEGDPRGGP